MRLALAADVVLDQLGVDSESVFLVVSNPQLAAIAAALAEAARRRTGRAETCEFPPTGRDGAEPPAAIAAAMRTYSAVALLTGFSLSHTLARADATQAGARIASLPGITREVFKRT